LPKGPGITLAQATDRYLASKARKRTIEEDQRQLGLLKAEFGAETPLAEVTASRISEYKAERLAAVRKIGEGESAMDVSRDQIEGLEALTYEVNCLIADGKLPWGAEAGR
jgi:hypothetical protein